MATPRPHATDHPIDATEFAALPQEAPYRLELARGRVVRAPRPGVLHGRLLLRLARLPERDPDTVRGPDIAFYSHARIPESGYATTYWGPPDLAVEIAPPGNHAGEMQERAREHLDAGVRLVWVIHPTSRTATAYRADGEVIHLGADGVLEGGEVLFGFTLPLTAFLSV